MLNKKITKQNRTGKIWIHVTDKLSEKWSQRRNWLDLWTYYCVFHYRLCLHFAFHVTLEVKEPHEGHSASGQDPPTSSSLKRSSHNFTSLPPKATRGAVGWRLQRRQGKESSSGLGVQHLQQQLVQGDAVVAVKLQEDLHGLAGRLPQQRERHEEPSCSPLLPAGRLVLLQGLVQLVLEPVHRVWAVQRVGICGATQNETESGPTID